MKEKKLNSPLSIVGFYFVVSAAWIAVSDTILGSIAADFDHYALLQTYKGWLFIGVSSALLFFIIRAHARTRLESFSMLKESEGRYRLLFENNPHPMWVYDLDTLKFLAVNDAAVAHYGFSRAEFFGMTVKDIRPREDETAFLRLISVAGSGLNNSGIWRHRKKDGSIISVEITAHTVQFDGHRARFVLAEDVTKRIEAEAQMKLQSSALQSAANGIVITDREGTIISVNPAFCNLTGYTKEEAIGTNPRFLKSGLQDDSFYGNLWKRIKAGDVWKGEVINRRKDGSLYSERMTITPLRDDQNEITHFIAIKEDVSERKRVEGALHQAEDKLRDIVEHSTNLFYSHTPDHEITYVSPQTRTFLDCEPEEALGQWTEFLTENPINQRGIALTEEAIQTGRRQEPYQLELIGKKGRKVWVEVREAPIVENGRTVAIVGSLSDITDRKKAENQIREQAALIDVSTDAVMVRNLQNEIAFWNKGAERLYGWSGEEAVGKKGSDMGLNGNGTFGRAMTYVLEHGKWEGELTQTTRDAKTVIVNSRWTLMKDEHGMPTSILVVNTDITQKKVYESQFLRAQRLESLGTLAGGIAHDLNNVLAPIILSFEILKRSIQDKKGLQFLEVAEQSALRGKNIVSQVLAFARGVEGERGSVQLRHLLKEIEQIAKETFPRSIEVVIHADKDLSAIQGDATQLHQVLMNLCLNARDAMPRGGSLKVSAENFLIDELFVREHLEAEPGASVLIKVSDTGTGIPKEIINRIFDPFFTTKEVGKGTGLGLSTVHAIVKSHGGFVDVETHVDKGTAFKVYLPACSSESGDESRKVLEELPAGKGKTILVVDDESAIRDITQDMLESYDYRVFTARDGVDAVSVFAKHFREIQLVLMDMMMPVMDGSASIRAIRRIAPNVKVIIASGLMTDGRSTELKGVEVQGFLSKPYSAEQLLRKLHEVLNTDEIPVSIHS